MSGGSPRSRARLGSRGAAAIVFLSAGAVLVLEILSLRLVAPYVGVTLETSTAVIGTALAAIALGAALGGAAADRWNASLLLGPVLLAAGALLLLVLPLVRWTGEMVAGTSSVAALVLPMGAVFLPAALLSSVSPMVVKIRLADLDRAGSVVGTFSGIGTLGALVATFVTGFVLVAALPSSVTLLVLSCVVLAMGAVCTLVLWRPRAAVAPLGIASLGIILGGSALANAPQPCDVETPYHCVRVLVDPYRPSGRTLMLDTLRHSYVDLDDPGHLEFRYIRSIAAAIDERWAQGEALRAVHIGGGGATMPRYLAATRPGSSNLVLEVDGQVVDVATERLGLLRYEGVEVRTGDGRALLSTLATDSADVVVGDAFSGLSVPWQLTTEETVREVARILSPGGVYALNVIDYPPLDFARAEIATVGKVFDHVAVASAPGAIRGTEGGNVVIVASDSPLPLTTWAAAVTGAVPDWTVTSGVELAAMHNGARPLTDDYAPVDRLLTTG